MYVIIFPMFPFFSSSDNSSFSRSIAAWELADASQLAMLSLHDQLSNWNRVWTFMIFLFSTKISCESPRKLTGVDCASKTITTEFKDVFQINNFMFFFLNVFKMTTKIRHLCIKHLPCIWFMARVDFLANSVVTGKSPFRPVQFRFRVNRNSMTYHNTRTNMDESKTHGLPISS